MIETKVYLYDSSKSDYKGTDYSANVLAGNGWADDLTETLDVASLTLVGLPFSEEFDPTTKFIVELWDTNVNTEFPYTTLSLAVEEDVVSQPVLSDDNYFNHAITFNEASVIAQGRVVDNCSETFELKNVNINDESVYSPSAMADGKNKPSATNDAICTYRETNIVLLRHSENIIYKRKFRWVFTEEYLQATDPNYGRASAWNDIKMYIPISGGEQVKLPIPLLGTQFGAKDSANYESHVNLCSVEVKVYESNDGVKWNELTALSKVVNPCSSNTRENDWQADWRLAERINSPANTKGYGINRARGLIGQMQELYKKFAEFDTTMSSRFVTIPLQANKQYCVIVQPKFFNTTTYELGEHAEQHLGMNNVLIGDDANMYYTYSTAFSDATTSLVSGFVRSADYNSTPIILPTIQNDTGMPMLKIKFSTFVAGSNVSTFLKSAPALSAYDLFRDALLKSQTTEKIAGTYIKDTPLAYYLDPSDIGKLQNAEIIESSFNQKNLWEILLEIGKYIHAIPYIEFGEDDRFVVRWRYLGQPEQFDNKATTMSIFNSRSIENYVGALNSYVTNMVQRGAQIEEWVAPKSESDDYLVYNDVATLNTTKPIIELLKLEFKCVTSNAPYYTASNTIYEITDHIYEHNIYELLDVVNSVTPNKGVAIYYNLGENIIRGLNYQLPAANAGDPEREYAIKNIIGTYILNNQTYWKNIRVNDFIFRVTYRTKEDVRSEQSRPDLRKYLINSKYENVPHHKQFNNQQDKMVDSVKFGNQVYGKLIKTGNTEYKTTEWNDNLYDLKKSGQLINIRGNIYYVARAEHTFFQDHIISEITYSKDYNKLSEIIGIPSEPRFFEISEQSQVDRQVAINDYIYIGETSGFNVFAKYLGEVGLEYVGNLLCGDKPYPKYALTQFKNDEDSSDPEQNLALFSKAFIHPLSAYSMRNTLTLKWEMKDNFSAGDRVEDTVDYRDSSRKIDTTYSKLRPTQYTDIYGRADLVDFGIITDIGSSELTKSNIRNFPLCPYRFMSNEFDLSENYGENEVGKYFTSLTYKYDTSDQNATTITASTARFKLHSNGATNYGDIYNNGVSIITHLNASVWNGDYFILLSDNLYCLFVYVGDDENNDIIFERMYITNNIAEMLAEISKPSFRQLGWLGDRVLVASSGADDPYATTTFGGHQHGLALVKDNRERIMFNYNLQMLTDSDRFVLSGYLWQQNKGTVKIALLGEEVNKIINDTIPDDYILRDANNQRRMFNISLDPMSGYACAIEISRALQNEDMSQVKAIALVSDKMPSVGNGTERYFVVARNVDGLSANDKKEDWFISPLDPNDFFKKQ